MLLIYRAARPHVAVLGRGTDATPLAAILVVRPDSGLFDGNADNLHSAIRDHLTDTTRAVGIDPETIARQCQR